ncbi:UbiA prenyltransferase family protein [Pendulispora albinea]|uniref:UbiA prenyltransferase family protein n=1 Tax=Pendulispora albinea TaxID=2741071 RepID=A0ABZ2MBN9_9BACT
MSSPLVNGPLVHESRPGPGQWARSWFDLVRIYNVPIPLCGMLAGAYAAPVEPTLRFLVVIFAAIVGSASTQSFNDYEDRASDATHAPFRPIPSGKLKSSSVLFGGHLLAVILAVVSLALEPMAVLPVFGAFALTRKYSALKKHTVLHHLMMPGALALTPLYGSLIVHGQVLPLAWISAAGIFLGDINMNVVGSFKDLWETSEQERVLPVVIGPKPAIAVALVCGVAGMAVQAGSVVIGWAHAGALIPLVPACALTIWSRLRLYEEPSAKVGYSALQAGRIAECLSFPALIAGVVRVDHALAIILCLMLLALYTQTIIPENILPDKASALLDDGQTNVQSVKS